MTKEAKDKINTWLQIAGFLMGLFVGGYVFHSMIMEDLEKRLESQLYLPGAYPLQRGQALEERLNRIEARNAERLKSIEENQKEIQRDMKEVLKTTRRLKNPEIFSLK